MDIPWRRAAACVVCRDDAQRVLLTRFVSPGRHAVGVVYSTTELRGLLRTEFDEGTTDDARWFSVDEARTLPHVELVDFVLGLIA